ncbi:MAG: hypothetical protein JXA60_02450 [Candidatus Coatesbacteria bacterium]|nr:hypothetical protein [Candidatus Coatesbacteria bacterium]
MNNIINNIMIITNSIYFKMALIIIVIYFLSRIAYRRNRSISTDFIKDIEPFFMEGIKISGNDQERHLQIEFRFKGGEGVFIHKKNENKLILNLYNSLFCKILIIPEDLYEILNMASPFPKEVHLIEIETNDSDFDKEYKIKTDNPDKARKILNNNIKNCIRGIHGDKKDFMTIIINEAEINIDRDISICNKDNLKLFLVNSKELGETFSNNLRKQL